jgi:hypothetical protein
MPAILAPYNQPRADGERLAQGHRCRLALASITPHNPAMSLDLTDDDKAILTELLREAIERQRFSLSSRMRRYREILAKLRPPDEDDPLGEAAMRR